MAKGAGCDFEEEDLGIGGADLPRSWDPWQSDTQPLGGIVLAASLAVAIPRFILCGIAAGLLGVFSFLQLALASLLLSEEDRIRWRWSLTLPIRLLARVGLLSAGIYQIEGMEVAATSDGKQTASVARIIVANHVSCADILALLWLLGPAFVAKSDALSIPYVALAARALGCVFVDRKDPQSRSEAVASIRALADNPQSPTLLIFPEGTTTNGLSVINFAKGAFLPAASVTPIAIAYEKGARKADSMFGLDTLAMMLRLRTRMAITLLPAYAPDELESQQPELFARNVRDAIAAELGMPVCDRWGREGFHRSRWQSEREGDVDAKAAVAAARPPRVFAALPRRDSLF